MFKLDRHANGSIRSPPLANILFLRSMSKNVLTHTSQDSNAKECDYGSYLNTPSTETANFVQDQDFKTDPTSSNVENNKMGIKPPSVLKHKINDDGKQSPCVTSVLLKIRINKRYDQKPYSTPSGPTEDGRQKLIRKCDRTATALSWRCFEKALLQLPKIIQIQSLLIALKKIIHKLTSATSLSSCVTSPYGQPT